ncbi:hypothetical protein GCM10010399_71870 [Dactylosporangium fulvum]|uniref:Polysaccharide deacetylase family protein n=1 Tax=Dactylosporangium fulvum TaxID=53359 RepID=A0ABY5W5C4_9ACTN|nr:polysaccharide deacetylase family protein [Dactylosporangium fulvum]UWP85112.1 polysaccharide deacetylase family protein [Dactylosporangium fulvum]
MHVPPAKARLLAAVLLVVVVVAVSNPDSGRTVRWVSSGRTHPQPSTSAMSASSAGGAYLARLPKFDKAPPAHPVTAAESDGAPWISRVPTDQPVAFVTIDDGWVKHPEAAELVRESRVPVTLFLAVNAIQDNPAYFTTLQDIGAVIEAHTITHPKLRGQSYAFQKHEICDGADQLTELFGRRPTMFRPPFGEQDSTTLRVVRDCGMKAALFWKETVNRGRVQYQEARIVQPGDVILMHFREQFVDDFIAALEAIKAAGLTPARLEDYFP